MTYVHAKCEVAMSNIWEEMHLQENTLFDLDLGVKVAKSVAQYLLHHVAYAHAQFEVARFNGLGGDA